MQLLCSGLPLLFVSRPEKQNELALIFVFAFGFFKFLF